MTTHAHMREGFGTVTFNESQYQTDSRKFGGLINNRMSVFIDKTPHTAVIRFTHNSLLGENLGADKIKSRENSVAQDERTGNDVVNKIDSHLRLLTSESNLRPTSSCISDKIDLGATQNVIPDNNDTEEGPNDEINIPQIDSHNVSSKTSSRKGLLAWLFVCLLSNQCCYFRKCAKYFYEEPQS